MSELGQSGTAGTPRYSLAAVFMQKQELHPWPGTRGPIVVGLAFR